MRKNDDTRNSNTNAADQRPQKRNEEGDFSTTIIVPATNFTAGFAKLGYLGIKRIFKEENIDCFSATIVQASDMKEKVEKKYLNENKVTEATLDIKNMYPSITFRVVKKQFRSMLET